MVSIPGMHPGSSNSGERQDNGWKRAVQGRTEWVSPPEPSTEELQKLLRWYPEVVELSEEEVRLETEGWAATAIVARSLGRRVAVEAITREFWLRAGVKGDVIGYHLEQGFLFFHFKKTEERDTILCWPWVVSGQALAVEPWRPSFFPVEGAICTALVWVHLPRLPVKLWEEAALRSVLSLAGELMLVDECTMERRRLGFARASIWIDLSRPLRPGVQVKRLEETFWQRYVYESLDGLCFCCGRFHPSEVACSVRRGSVLPKPAGWMMVRRRKGHGGGRGWWSSASGSRMPQ